MSREGVVFGLEPPAITSREIRKQFGQKTGVYCLLFDTRCFRTEDTAEREKAAAPIRAEPLYSYRERVQKSPSRKVKIHVSSHEGHWIGQVTVLLGSETDDASLSPKNILEFTFVLEEREWRLAAILYG